MFTEDIVCTQALRVQPTVALSGNMTGFYPIHCVYNLLKSQTFLKHSIAVTVSEQGCLVTMVTDHQLLLVVHSPCELSCVRTVGVVYRTVCPLWPVSGASLLCTVEGWPCVAMPLHLPPSLGYPSPSPPPQPWVVAQVMTAAEPLHPTLQQLIQELVPAILAPPTRATYGTGNSSGITFRQTPISEQELLKVFRVTSDPAPSCATQLLLLYYVLLYHNTWLGNLKAYSAHLKTPPPTYSPHVLGSMPVKWLLQQARRRQSDYAVLYPSLVKLVITHLPHIAMTTSGLEESYAMPVLKSSDKFTPQSVEQGTVEGGGGGGGCGGWREVWRVEGGVEGGGR